MDSFPALRRSRDDAMLAGVCFAVAKQLRVDPLLVRIATVVLALSSGFGVALYAWAWLVLPQAGRTRSLAQEWFGQTDDWSPQRLLTVGLVGSLVCSLLLGPVAGWGVGPGIVLIAMVLLARRQRPDDVPLPPRPAEAPVITPNSGFDLATQAWADRLQQVGHPLPDEPTVALHRPGVSTDHATVRLPTAVQDEATIALDTPTVPLDEPTIALEEPTVALTEPTIKLDEPTLELTEPTRVLDVEATRQLPPPNNPPSQLAAPQFPPPQFPPAQFPPPAVPHPAAARPAAWPVGPPPTTAHATHSAAVPPVWTPPVPVRRRVRKSWLLGLLVLGLSLAAALTAPQLSPSSPWPITDVRLLQHGVGLGVLALALLGCALLRLPRPRMAVLAGVLVVASALAPPIEGSAVQPRDVVWTSTAELPQERIELAATEGRFDLSRLDLSGVGSTPARISIRATAADVELVLPEDAAVRIDYRLTAADLEVAKDGSVFTADGQRIGSWPEQATDQPRLVIDLQLQAASGTVRHA
ncbi:PspC domain-containing protein [Luteococcus sp. H138]|uniref:PspC domain-containing protein n=1 Tax=unclassified Luteococcus TaxID=2639923 RepID=UPI00313ED739